MDGRVAGSVLLLKLTVNPFLPTIFSTSSFVKVFGCKMVS